MPTYVDRRNVPDCTINEVLWRNVEVDVLRATRLVGPGPAERRVEVVGRVEIQAERGQVLTQRQRHQVRVGLGRSYERQQANDAELVVDHAGRYVRHSPVRVRLDTLRHICDSMRIDKKCDLLSKSKISDRKGLNHAIRNNATTKIRNSVNSRN